MSTAVIFKLLFISFAVNAAAKSYDFIIVGGGSSGAMLAYRLTESKSTSVLMLERGEDRCDTYHGIVGFYGSLMTADPDYMHNILSKGIDDRHYFTNEVNRRSSYMTVATMLGGGATRNGNAFGRMSAAEMEGFNSSLWTFNATVEDWKDLFSFDGCLEGPCNTEAHGTRGPLRYKTFPLDPVLQVVNTTYSVHHGLAWDDDSNDGTNLGLSIMHRNIKSFNGKPYRQDSYCELLKPIVSSRKNLDILTSATVLKIEFAKNGKHKVQYLHEGKVHTDKAKKEVILANGVFDSVQLLELSGVGNCSHMYKFGIPCLHENNHVGENLIDNSNFGSLYVTPMPPPAEENYGSILVAYKPYEENPSIAGLEMAATSFHTSTPMGNVTALFTYIADFEHGSIGNAHIKSDNPLREPRVSADIYASKPEKVNRIRDAFRISDNALHSVNEQMGFPYFTRISPSYTVLPLNATDAQIDAYILSDSGFTMSWHPTGTTSMHKVVDERLRLIDGEGKVIKGVRVVTNGIIPNNMRSHSTSSFSMFSGQVASRFIKEEYGI